MQLNVEAAISQRAEQLFCDQRQRNLRRVDRMFAALMIGQWIFAILMAIFFSPYGWSGKVKAVHLHVYLAVFLGAAISSFPIVLVLCRPGRASTRQVVAGAQMLWSALLIHLSGGRVETHFHVFGSLAFLAFYRDWRVLPTATVVVAADHFVRGIVWPESVYGVLDAEWWRFLEHAFWVLFIDAFLAMFCVNGVKELRQIAQRTAQAEVLSETREQHVQERTAQLAEAQEIAHLGSWDWDIRDDRVTWSAELYRIFGLDRESFRPTYQGVLDRIHPEDRPAVTETISRAQRDQQPFSIEHRIVRPGGEVRVLYARGRVLIDEAGLASRMVGTAEDVTEYRQIQARLILSERMTSVGTLAAGVAHEINNPLAYVMSNVSFAPQALPEISRRVERLEAHAHSMGEASRDLAEVAEVLGEAAEGAVRVRNIVRDLKTFSRADDEHRKSPVDVRRVLESSINMAWNEIRHRARLVKDYGPTPQIRGNESRVGQVFLNLLINAAQAIPEGHADRNEIRLRTSTDAHGRAVVEVRDTGPGIPQELRERIFDPFFTTKPVGVGTGLGLSICHGIVTAMGGEITVESDLGRGSVFRVVLPPAALESVATEPQSVATTARRGRILIVDDEPMVSASLRRMLASGHEVVSVTSGREALDLIARGERFDVLLCDLMMPEISGMDVHANLLRVAPDQVERMIFMTGGAFTASARQFLDRVPNPRFEKPFEAQNLLAVVSSFCSAARPGAGARDAPVLRLVGG